MNLCRRAGDLGADRRPHHAFRQQHGHHRSGCHLHLIDVVPLQMCLATCRRPQLRHKRQVPRPSVRGHAACLLCCMLTSSISSCGHAMRPRTVLPDPSNWLLSAIQAPSWACRNSLRSKTPTSRLWGCSHQMAPPLQAGHPGPIRMQSRFLSICKVKLSAEEPTHQAGACLLPQSQLLGGACLRRMTRLPNSTNKPQPDLYLVLESEILGDVS